MPLYRYKCEDCGSIMQVLEGVGRGNDEVRCKSCGSINLTKLLPQSLSIGGRKGSEYECCGMANPCDNPKRCCQNL